MDKMKDEESASSEGVLDLKCQLVNLNGNASGSVEHERGFALHPQLLFRELEEEASLWSGYVMPSILVTLRMLSLVGCLVTFIVLHVIRLPRTPRLIVQKQRSFTLLLYYLLFLVDTNVIELPCYLCLPIGVATHFFGLASHTWTLVEASLLFKTIVLKQPMSIVGEHTTLKYMAISYGLPVVGVGSILLGIESSFIKLPLRKHGKYPENCWFRSQVYSYGFVLPVGVMMVVNLFILVAVLRAMNNRIPSSSTSPSQKTSSSLRVETKHRIVRQETNESSSSRHWPMVVKHVRVLVILSFLLGLNGCVAVLKLLDPHWTVYFMGASICNCSGIFFFVHSVVLNKAVKARLSSQWRKILLTRHLLSKDISDQEVNCNGKEGGRRHVHSIASAIT